MYVRRVRRRDRLRERFPGIDWWCDKCNASLNQQTGFDDHCDIWKCTECGYRNRISEEEIYASEEEFRKKKIKM